MDRAACLKLYYEFEETKNCNSFKIYKQACQTFIDAAYSYFDEYGISEGSPIIKSTFLHDIYEKLNRANHCLVCRCYFPKEKDLYEKAYWQVIDSLEKDVEILKTELERKK